MGISAKSAPGSKAGMPAKPEAHFSITFGAQAEYHKGQIPSYLKKRPKG